MGDYRDEVAAFIDAVLERKGWSYQQAADAVGVDRTTIFRAAAKHSTPRFETMVALARRGGVAFSDALLDAAAAYKAPKERKAEKPEATIKDILRLTSHLTEEELAALRRAIS